MSPNQVHELLLQQILEKHGPCFLLTVEQTEPLVNIDATTIYKLQDSGDFPLRRIGRKKLVPVAELPAWSTSAAQMAAAPDAPVAVFEPRGRAKRPDWARK